MLKANNDAKKATMMTNHLIRILFMIQKQRIMPKHDPCIYYFNTLIRAIALLRAVSALAISVDEACSAMRFSALSLAA